MELPFIPRKPDKNFFHLLARFLVLLILISSYGFLASNVNGQAPPCYIGPSSSCKTAGSGDFCPSGQTQCQGTTNEDGAGSLCYTCGQGNTTESSTCSTRNFKPSGSAKKCGELYDITDVDCAEVSGGLAGCYATNADGCQSCVTPICTLPKVAVRGQCVENITCSTTALATGTTIGEAKSKIDSGDKNFYDRINWYLNNNLVGTTVMNSDGTGSNNFSGLTPGTAYEAKAEYFASDLSRPAVSCTPLNFYHLPFLPLHPNLYLKW